MVVDNPPLEPEILADALLQQGVIVRVMTAFGMPGGIRISVGSQADNEKVVAAFKKALSQSVETS